MSRTRKAAFAGGVLAASLLFAAGGASAAHAEMTDPPTQAEVDWTPGGAGTYSTGSGAGGGAGAPWVAGAYSYSMTNYAGYDFWTRKDGQAPQLGDADNLAKNMNYGGGCVVPWWTDRVMCHD